MDWCLICRRGRDVHKNYLSHSFIGPYDRVCKICHLDQKAHSAKTDHKFRLVKHRLGLRVKYPIRRL